jgi:hypothetical protein
MYNYHNQKKCFFATNVYRQGIPHQVKSMSMSPSSLAISNRHKTKIPVGHYPPPG